MLNPGKRILSGSMFRFVTIERRGSGGGNTPGRDKKRNSPLSKMWPFKQFVSRGENGNGTRGKKGERGGGVGGSRGSYMAGRKKVPLVKDPMRMEKMGE